MAAHRTCTLVSVLLITLSVALRPAHAVTWGDVNDDGTVDVADIDPFIDVLLEQNTDPTAICAADVNSNGVTDAADIPYLVDAILNGASQLLISDNSAPCAGGPFRRIEDGDVLNICGSFSGLSMLFLTVRFAGFDPGAVVDLSYSIRYPNAQSGCPTTPCPPTQHCDNGICFIGYGTFENMPTTDIGCGLNEASGGEAPFDILFTSLAALDGQEVILSVTVTDSSNPSRSVSKTLQPILDTLAFCFNQQQCPADHTCIDSYCVPN